MEEPRTVLFAEKLRDGRVALGTRTLGRDGEWVPGELHLLEPSTYLDLAAWLAPAVEAEWIATVRERRAEPLRTAGELYGEEAGAVERVAQEILEQIPPALLARAMILLANSMGPQARARLIDRLNRIPPGSEEQMLRRQITEEGEAFAYVVAAAGLFDALDQGLTPDDA